MEAGVVEESDEVTDSDFEAIKERAKVLAENGPLPVETLFVAGYKDRMQYLGKIVDAQLKQLPDAVIQGIIKMQSGYIPNAEEIEMLRDSDIPFDQWISERSTIRESLHDTHVVINNDDTVIASGSSPEEALHHAQEEKGFENRNTL